MSQRIKSDVDLIQEIVLNGEETIISIAFLQ